jgi:hypothetical protein
VNFPTHFLQEIGVGGTCAWKLCGIDPNQAISLFFESANAVSKSLDFFLFI